MDWNIQEETAGETDLILHLKKMLDENKKLLIGIDGRCASGKTTLSLQIAKQLPARIFHMDDFYLPFEQRQEDWQHIPCANMNFTRLTDTVLVPAGRGETVHYQAYSCREKQLLPATDIAYEPLTIVEGSYSLYPSLQPFYDLTIFLTCDRKTQKERLLKREGERYPNYERLWIPLEEAYYKKYSVREHADMVIST